LFAELGKKIDHITAYLRTQQHKANIAAEEAQRLQRLEGDLNTIRLQTNSQASLRIDDGSYPRSSVCIPEAFRITC